MRTYVEYGRVLQRLRKVEFFYLVCKGIVQRDRLIGGID